jgi:serine/threonine protein kinase
MVSNRRCAHFPFISNIAIARNIICKLLVYEPEERHSVSDAMQHHWIQKDIDRLGKLYQEVNK